MKNNQILNRVMLYV